MQQVKFTTYGSAHGVGGFAPGTLAWVPDDMARHLVDDVGCAEYVSAVEPLSSPPAESAQAEAKPIAARRAKRGQEASA